MSNDGSAALALAPRRRREGPRGWLARPAPAAAAAAAAATAAITFLLYAGFVLNHFYQDGASRDGWILGAILWRNGVSLDLPAGLVHEPRTFFGSHVSPVFLLPALLSNFVPVGMVQWLAIWIGAMHAVLPVVLLRVLIRDFGLGTPGGLLVATPLALGLAFSGLAIAQVLQPHYELLLVELGLLFLAAFARGDRRWSWTWLLLALAVREDAGLHLFGILLLAQLACPRRGTWTLMAVAVLWSAAAFAIKSWSGTDEGLISLVYTGSPPYAHVTYQLLMDRLIVIWNYRPYLWTSPIVVLAWAVLARDPLIAVGTVAQIPWLALHLTAITWPAGTLQEYYAFPFVFGLVWPLIAVVWRHGTPVEGSRRRAAVAWQAALILSAVFGWFGGRFVLYPAAVKFPLGDAVLNAAMIDGFATRLAAGQRELGGLRADYGTVGLLPRALTPDNALPPTGTVRGVDTVVWFDPGEQDSQAWGAWTANRLGNHYRVVGSSIMIASNRRLDQSPLLAAAVVPASAMWRRMRPAGGAVRQGDAIVIAREQPGGVLASGPHEPYVNRAGFAQPIMLPEGRYEARFLVAVNRLRDPFGAVLRVEAGSASASEIAGAVELASAALPPEVAAGRQPTVLALQFAIDEAASRRPFQLRAIHLGTADVALHGVSLTRID